MKRNILLGVSCIVMVVVGAIFMSTTGSTQSKNEAVSASTTLVISQANGGGGGSTGTYIADYVEIKNISATTQSLNGLSLAYGSATGQFASSGTNAFALPDVTIAPGKYFLVQLGALGSAGAALPTPDATTTNLSMSGTNGKVALVTSAFAPNTCGATATPCTLPNAAIVDLVAYGAASNAEGDAPTNAGAALTSSQGNVRKGNGCTDTDNNNSDFDVATAPVPKNSSSPAITCGSGGATPTPTPTATTTPTPSPTPTPGPTTPKFLFTTRLNGVNEVPTNASAGTGFGRVVLNAAETQITASVYWENLGSNTVSGHIHTGAVGVSGPITFDMAPPTGATRGMVVDKTFAITPAQVATLRAGGMYFNIHSTNFSGGEIRGQLLSSTSDAPLDFNGDGKTDFGVVRPGNTGTGAGTSQIRWYNLLNNAAATQTQVDFGVDTDSITPGDFDGDGKDDIAIFRPQTNNSFFYILQSSTNTLRTIRFGIPNDDPYMIADYDGDGVDDPAIFRKGDPDTAQAYFWWYGSYGTTKNVQVVVPWGVGLDVAAPGDYNGDGKADFCVYRGVGTPARGIFFIHYGTGLFDAASANDTATRFGLPNDAIVPGDYDGDGKTDLAVTRQEGAALAWYYIPSSGGTVTPRIAWGRNTTDLEVQGDYDGDGKTDQAVWRSTPNSPGVYYILRSSDGAVQYQFWGLFLDAPAAQDSHF